MCYSLLLFVFLRYNSDMKIFEGKTAVVVGGSGGIGFETAKMLCRNGARVIIHGRNEERLQSAKIKLYKEASVPVDTVIFDFDKESFVSVEKSSLNQAVKTADILCICFGPFLQKGLEDMNAEQWQRISLLDYALPGFLMSSCLNGMKEKKWGRILLFGGTGTSFRGEFKTNAAYAGAKTGLGVLVQSAAANYARYGITCNAILPGFTETEYLGQGDIDSLKEKIPGGELISAEKIAKAAEFLLSDVNFNGVLLKIDRGWSPSN